ncbi:glycosyltransferase family 4 protein [Luteibacter sp.]|jgi:glycosyltransferase involved in cell wall biosynthesis|uniref:glycosyltransferase family 4 protein n=1 Tax=Luteibacter sp. TaxID=1886636 RepID=UPI002F40B1D6
MKIMLFANTAWYLYNFRLGTAIRLRELGHDVLLASPSDPYASRFERHGLRWREVPMCRGRVDPLREARTVRAIVAALRDERPDVLHNFTLRCAVYGAFAARVVGIPSVVNAITGMGYVYAGDDSLARVLRPLLTFLMRRTLDRRSSLLVLQNPDDAAAVARAGLVDLLRIRVIRGSGVDTERFHPVPHEEGRLRVVLASRLLREKGVEEFVEAARLLRRGGRDIDVVLSGAPDPGNPHSIAPERVAAWHAEGIVRCVGHVDDMASLLATADVMVLPSYYGEGVPRSLIEGAAAGLAIVTTDMPGCREVVVRDGVDGLLVPCKDAASLANAIARLDADRPLLRRLASRARANAVAHFDQSIVIDQTLRLYAELLGCQQLRAAAVSPAPAEEPAR